VRRDEDGVLVGQLPSALDPMSIVDVGRGGGVVPERQRAVRCSSVETATVSVMMPVTFEAAENEPISVGRSAWRTSSRSRWSRLDVAVGVLVDDHHVGDRLAPRQLVRVVLVRADEHHRPLVGRDRGR
jgi:hypothetical protein